jgi:hypothetical protein
MELTGLDQLWIADIAYIRLESDLFAWPWYWMRTHGA